MGFLGFEGLGERFEVGFRGYVAGPDGDDAAVAGRVVLAAGVMGLCGVLEDVLASACYVDFGAWGGSAVLGICGLRTYRWRRGLGRP